MADVKLFEVSVQHRRCDGQVGGEADADQRPGQEDLLDRRGQGCDYRSIRAWRTEQYVFGPVGDVHGPLDVRGPSPR
jgi:hypothetical protein